MVSSPLHEFANTPKKAEAEAAALKEHVVAYHADQAKKEAHADAHPQFACLPHPVAIDGPVDLTDAPLEPLERCETSKELDRLMAEHRGEGGGANTSVARAVAAAARAVAAAGAGVLARRPRPPEAAGLVAPKER
ncbi:hypothetical protein T492DRAFT_856718 [Pavlovales sp. CCMP2436]|nr:hypothetical protein T492DRAFT_856718 [Pavlovales sp. CCMP2436]